MACSLEPNIEGVPHSALADALNKHKELLSKGKTDASVSYSFVKGFLTLDEWNLVLENLEKSESPNIAAAIVESGKPTREFLNNEINTWIEEKRGIASDTVITEGDITHESLGKYYHILRSSANDIEGLAYAFFGKGKRGVAQQKVFDQYILDQYWLGKNAINADVVNSNDYVGSVLKANKEAASKLGKKAGYRKYTNEQAIRVYNFRAAAVKKAENLEAKKKQDLDYKIAEAEERLGTRLAKITKGLSDRKTALVTKLNERKAKELKRGREKRDQLKDPASIKESNAKLAELEAKVDAKIKALEEKATAKLKEVQAKAETKIKAAKEKIVEQIQKLNEKADAEIASLRHGVPGLNDQGMSNKDIAALKELVSKDKAMLALAKDLSDVFGDGQYTAVPTKWIRGSIKRDIKDHVKKVRSKEHLAKFARNADAMFSPNNLAKIEAAYGPKRRKAIEDRINAMKGTITPGKGGFGDAVAREFMDFINNSVGTTLFYNRRSALLQSISTLNYLNWDYNSIDKAAKARLDTAQYKADKKLMMSRFFLRERKLSNTLDINLRDLNEIIDRDVDGAGVWEYIKQQRARLANEGFRWTKFMDAYAIASGGAIHYRNRVNHLLKGVKNPTQEQIAAIEEQAMFETEKLSRKSQQSSDAALTSSEQNSPLGVAILAYANTPMQYTRIGVKSVEDLIHGRGDAATNIARATYYFGAANILFSFIGKYLNLLLEKILGVPDEDEEDLMPADLIAKEVKQIEKYSSFVGNSLRGFGIAGAVLNTIQVFGIEAIHQMIGRKERSWRNLLLAALSLSPPIQSKVRSSVKAVDYLIADETFKPSLLDKPKALSPMAHTIAEGLRVLDVPVYRITNTIEEANAVLRHNLNLADQLGVIYGSTNQELDIDFKFDWDDLDSVSPKELDALETIYESRIEEYYEKKEQDIEDLEKYYQ